MNWRLLVQKTRVIKKIFSSRRKVVSDDAARTADGKLFHARGAATENDRSPRVDRLTGSTIRVTVMYHSVN